MSKGPIMISNTFTHYLKTRN